MTDGTTHDSSEEEPTTEELREPSTEKDPGQEPKAPEPHDPDPSHQAAGIGVVGGPLTNAKPGRVRETDHGTE